MALIVKDRVREASTTTGTGTLTLTGAISGFQSFSAIGDANDTYYTIVNAGTGDWEVGIGTYTASGTTLSRSQVLESSNGGALVNFGAGIKDVFGTYPADRSVSQADIGTAPNEIPLNQYLGSAAYVDINTLNAGSLTNTTDISNVQPSLNLDFANVKKLDPRITYARASEARYYDGKTVSKAEENLLKYSQEFDNASWDKNGGGVSANSTTAPDNTTTADTFTETASTTYHFVRSSATNGNVISGLTYTYSQYFKKGVGATAPDIVQMSFNSPANAYANFNISTGVVTATGAGITNSAIVLTNGFYRCSVTIVATSTGIAYCGAFLTDNNPTAVNSPQYLGNVTSDIYLWGAQLEQRSAVSSYTPTTTQPITIYQPTLLTASANVARFDHDPITNESLGLLIEEQRTNLMTYSEDLSNAGWVKNNSTITANIIVAPDGTLTGDKLVENTSLALHLTYQSKTVTATSHTATVYAKSGGRNWLRMDLTSASTVGAYFDLENVAVGTVTAGYTASITSVGDGWCRCSLTTTTTAALWYVQIFSATANGTVVYTGDGYSGIYLWGAQLEVGGFSTSYIPTVASQVTRSADSASMTGANFSSWYRADEGTLYTDFAPVGVGTAGWYYWFSLNLSSANSIAIRQYATGTNNYRIDYNGTAQATNDVGASLANVYKKIGLVYKFNDIASVYDGSNLTVDSTANIPDVTRFDIGGSFGVALKTSLYVKKISYFPARLSNEELQEMTS